MARTKAALGSGARLADYLSASLMARVVPPAIVHEVLDARGRNSRRIRPRGDQCRLPLQCSPIRHQGERRQLDRFQSASIGH